MKLLIATLFYAMFGLFVGVQTSPELALICGVAFASAGALLSHFVLLPRGILGENVFGENMDANEKLHRERIGEYVDQMEAILEVADKDDKRNLTEDESTEWEAINVKAEAEKDKLKRHLATKKHKAELDQGAKPIDDKGKQPEITGNEAEGEDALNEFTAKMYRALCNPSLHVSEREKHLKNAVTKLAEGGHYGNKYRNAVDAFQTVIDEDGGIWLPSAISDTIMSLSREYGAFPKYSMNFPLSVGQGRLKIPNYTGDLTFTAVNEGSEANASKFSFKAIELEAKKWMCFVPWTNEIDSAAASRLVPIINEKLAEAWAGVIDNSVINGDGTSTYHNLKGFINRSADSAAPEVRLSTAISDHDSFGEITLPDLVEALLDLAPSVRASAIYVMHPDWDVRLRKLVDGDNRPLYLNNSELSLTNGEWFISGRRVVFTEKAPNTDGTSKSYALLYNPKYLAIADANGFMADQLTEASILASDGTTRIRLGAQDMRALRVKGFMDYEMSQLVISSGGNSLGAFTVLRTYS